MSVTSPSPLCMWNLAFVPSSKCSPDTCRIATVSTHGCGVKSTMGVGEGEKTGHGSAASVHRACCVVQRCARSDSACSVDSWRCFSSRVLPQAQPHADTGPWHLRILATLVLTYAGIHGRFGKSYHASTLLASVLQPDHPVVTLRGGMHVSPLGGSAREDYSVRVTCDREAAHRVRGFHDIVAAKHSALFVVALGLLIQSELPVILEVHCYGHAFLRGLDGRRARGGGEERVGSAPISSVGRARRARSLVKNGTPPITEIFAEKIGGNPMLRLISATLAAVLVAAYCPSSTAFSPGAALRLPLSARGNAMASLSGGIAAGRSHQQLLRPMPLASPLRPGRASPMSLSMADSKVFHST